MGVRNMLILFFSAMAVSLVILIIFFSLFFKNIDFSFDAKLPESAPDVDSSFGNNNFSNGKMAKSNGLHHANVNVPQDLKSAPLNAVGVGVKAGEEDSAANQAATTRPLSSPADTSSVEGKMPSDASIPPTADTLGKKPVSKKASASKGSLPDNLPPIPSPVSPSPMEDKPTLPSQQGARRTGTYQVYIDQFKSKEEAQAKAKALQDQGIHAIVKDRGKTAIVQLGTFSSEENADNLATQAGAKVSSHP